ncbi:hypothetical protein JZ751_005351 [Albula glossodonta]|uniref:Uncharacterized protein n=1 Tax=Albula glossodonta TaxID=121402 RepID=A0A8T2N4J8_9TELE|nr:hypothetical protein JZ751_005351 [Albula glossodonta]
MVEFLWLTTLFLHGGVGLVGFGLGFWHFSTMITSIVINKRKDTEPKPITKYKFSVQLQYKCFYGGILRDINRINLAVKLRGVVVSIQHAHNDAGCAGARGDSSVYSGLHRYSSSDDSFTNTSPKLVF